MLKCSLPVVGQNLFCSVEIQMIVTLPENFFFFVVDLSDCIFGSSQYERDLDVYLSL